MKVNTNTTRQNLNQKVSKDKYSDVPLFPKKVQLIILVAFVLVIGGIVATTAYIFNMVFNPTVSANSNTEQKK